MFFPPRFPLGTVSVSELRVGVGFAALIVTTSPGRSATLVVTEEDEEGGRYDP